MSIIPASALSASDLCNLGGNLAHAVRHDRDHVEAVNRSLRLHDEHVERLYRRSGRNHTDRLPRRAVA